MEWDLSLGVPEWPSCNSVQALQEEFKIIPADIYSYPPAIDDEELKPLLRVLKDYFSACMSNHLSFSTHNGGRAAINDILRFAKSSLGATEIFLQSPSWFGYSEILSRSGLITHSLAEYVPSNTKKIILVCLPNNPSGSVDLEFDIDEATTVVIDLVYFAFLSKSSRDAISVFVESNPRQVILVFSTSKTCCAPGVRIAYVASKNTEMTTALKSLQKESYNLPSRITRRISTLLWSNVEEINNARDTYADLRKLAESEFIDSGLNYTIFGMFIWVVIQSVNADQVISEVRDRCGYLGASGVRFGDPNGTRWALRKGVDYKNLVEALVMIKGTKETGI